MAFGCPDDSSRAGAGGPRTPPGRRQIPEPNPLVLSQNLLERSLEALLDAYAGQQRESWALLTHLTLGAAPRALGGSHGTLADPCTGSADGRRRPRAWPHPPIAPPD